MTRAIPHSLQLDPFAFDFKVERPMGQGKMRANSHSERHYPRKIKDLMFPATPVYPMKYQYFEISQPRNPLLPPRYSLLCIPEGNEEVTP
jgi:hypothetical protein